MPYTRKMVNLFQQRDLFFLLIVLESFNKRPVLNNDIHDLSL
jgi:hypothetical protein